MKCSLKDGFISVLLIIFIAPSEGAYFPSFLHSSVLDKPLSFQKFRATMNKLQDFDSFPEVCENQEHKIVKKQMAVSNYIKDVKKRKRSVFVLPKNFESVDRGDGDNVNFRVGGKIRRAENGFGEYGKDFLRGKREPKSEEEAFFEKLKNFVGRRKIESSKKEENKKIVHTGPTTEDELTNTEKKLGKGQNDQKIINRNKAQENMVNSQEDITGAQQKFKTQEKGAEEKAENSKENLNKDDEKIDSKVEGKMNQKDVEEKTGQNEGEEKMSQKEVEDLKRLNIYLAKKLNRIPDENDYRCYYECEENPIGCLKLKHKRCPNGQFFSNKYRKCLKAEAKKRRRSSDPNKFEVFEPDPGPPEEPEPANEWLDASQGVNQKIPSEFKPKKKPGLKIYHLRVKRKLNEILRNEIYENHVLGRPSSPRVARHRFTEGPFREVEKRRHHIPRSFLIRINRKEGESGQRITESDENNNDNDEDDDENEEEEEEEEVEDEDEESEEEESHSKESEKSERKESFKDLLKSAKEAVTNRARFEEPAHPTATGVQSQKSSASSKSKKSGDQPAKEKKVLIDANIKVDSAFSSVLKSLLKDKSKGKETRASSVSDDEALISDRGSQDQLDPELLRVYEHLMRSNPRVKRYFLANYTTRRSR